MIFRLCYFLNACNFNGNVFRQSLEGSLARSFRLRTEVIFHITLLLGAALLFGGALMLKLTERELLKQRIADLTAAAEVTGGALAAMLADGQDLEILKPRVARFLKYLPAGTDSGVWQYAGNALRPVFRSNFKQADIVPRQLMTLRFLTEPQTELSYSNWWFGLGKSSPRYFQLTIPLVHQDRFAGVFLARFPLDSVGRRVMSSFKLLLVYVVLYGVVLFFFGLYQIKRNVVEPIGTLVVSTRQVAGGNLEEKVPETGPVEIVSLARSFNAMVDALRESRQRTDETIDSLQEANEKLKTTSIQLLRSEKMASVGRLAAGMAHEIGNPLAAVVGYVELLKQELPHGRNRDLAGYAGKEVERIDQLVRELLDYAKPGEEREECFDPAGVFREALSLLKRQGLFEGVVLSEELPKRLPCVRMVPQRLMQVLINLLVNARDASRLRGRICLAAGEHDMGVWFSVADEGQGISTKDLARIFDPFFTTKEPGKGRGLGLSVCHRVVEEAGGTIEVQSELGKGSVFVVHLKRERNQDAD